MAHEDIKYEQACILYNLGELPKHFPMVLTQPGQPRISAQQQATKAVG